MSYKMLAADQFDWIIRAYFKILKCDFFAAWWIEITLTTVLYVMLICWICFWILPFSIFCPWRRFVDIFYYIWWCDNDDKTKKLETIILLDYNSKITSIICISFSSIITKENIIWFKQNTNERIVTIFDVLIFLFTLVFCTALFDICVRWS